MHHKRDEDLFKDSTMTFGEHLEELRVCLFKALIGLVIGVAIGLFIGDSVVRFIERPLQQALKGYYQNKALDEWEEAVQRDRDAGLATSYQREAVEGFVKNDGMIPETVYLPVDGTDASLADGDAANQIRPNPPGHELSRVGPTAIIPSDLVDPAGFCRQLAEAGKPGNSSAKTPARLVWNLLESDQRGQVQKFAAQTKLDQDQRGELATALTGLVLGGGLDDPSYFTGVKLRPEAIGLQKRREHLSEEEQRRLARLRLESAFPNHIAATHPDLRKVIIWRPTEKTSMMRPVTLNAQEAFMIYMKASIVSGIVFSSPWVFFQLWTFVAAGLYPHEKRYVHIFLPFSLGLFLAGASLAFFFVFKPVLTFLFSFNDWLNIDPTPRISEWLSFVLILPLGFGISFQLPLVMLFLERINIFSVEAYLSKWRIAIMTIFVISAVLTPADPWSILLMALPLTVLYYLGVQLCRFMPRLATPYDEPA